VASQSGQVRRRDDGKVDALREMMSNAIKSADPGGAHGTRLRLFFPVHEVIQNDRPSRFGEQLAEAYSADRRISNIEARSHFLKCIVLHSRTLRKLPPQFRHSLPLIPQLDFGKAQFFAFGKIFFTLVRQIGLPKSPVDRLLYHDHLLEITLWILIPISPILASQYTLHRKARDCYMRSKRIRIIAIVWVALAVGGVIVFQRFRSAPQHGQQPPQAGATETPDVQTVYAYEVVREFPHDAEAFTQGLIFLDGYLYESTGRTGRSSVRKVRLETGEVVQQRAVDRRDYGEGLTEWRGTLVQLTPRRRGSEPPWHISNFFEDVRRHFGYNIGWTYDISSFEPRSSFKYWHEGWGITHDERRLIMSDGSSKLRFLDPESFTELGSLEVFDGGRPLENLNELEFINGSIYANISLQDRIAIIQSDSGKVTGWIDLAGLKSRMPPLPEQPLRAALNGIAYDAKGERVFVTGKLWPKVFEIRLRP
jgi:glutamine cyclotransferase